MTKQNKIRISCTIDADVWEQVARLNQLEHRNSMSSTTNMLLLLGLEKYDEV